MARHLGCAALAIIFLLCIVAGCPEIKPADNQTATPTPKATNQILNVMGFGGSAPDYVAGPYRLYKGPAIINVSLYLGKGAIQGNYFFRYDAAHGYADMYKLYFYDVGRPDISVDVLTLNTAAFVYDSVTSQDWIYNGLTKFNVPADGNYSFGFTPVDGLMYFNLTQLVEFSPGSAKERPGFKALDFNATNPVVS